MAVLVITIDGPAASGKSTIARLLAKKLGASFLDTGSMYRAVTFAAMQEGVDFKNEESLLGIFENNDFRFSAKNDLLTVQINGIDVTEKLRDPEVTANACYIASAPKVREKLVQMQRQYAAEQERIVTEGRDQGTVVFPDANAKFFLIAQSRERAKRRLAELQAKGINESLEKIQESIEKRDKSDSERDVGPLKPAQDAIEIDTTDLNIDQVLNKILGFVLRSDSFSD
jgi:cytidylate kinase